MYKNNTPYISPRYEKQDYLRLNLTINSSAADFDTAIDIFCDRIHGRFLEQIHRLTYDYDKNGFAIMALECLLIETFAQFKNGVDDTIGVSAVTYADFLFNDLRCFPSLVAAKKFYTYIRCGILHQAQTKPYSGLTFGASTAIDWRNSFLMVSVDLFVDQVDIFFSDYCRKLRDDTQTALRTNFIKKMDFICKR